MKPKVSRPLHLTSSRSPSTVDIGHRFTDIVAGLLNLRGYDVTFERLLASKKVDLVAEIREFAKLRTTAVECKNQRARLDKVLEG